MLHSHMMTSSNGNIFRVTGPLYGEFNGHRWIPSTKASDAELWSLICVWINGWVNNRGAGDLRRYGAHYDVTVMRTEVLETAMVCHVLYNKHYIDGLVHKRRNSSALAMELLLSCTNPSIYIFLYLYFYWYSCFYFNWCSTSSRHHVQNIPLYIVLGLILISV